MDHAFGPTSTQEEVYSISCKDVVDDVINGYNGCIIAYGQTGRINSHFIYEGGYWLVAERVSQKHVSTNSLSLRDSSS